MPRNARPAAPVVVAPVPAPRLDRVALGQAIAEQNRAAPGPKYNVNYGSGSGGWGSAPGEITIGMQPGERSYNPDTNTWGKKM